MRDTDRWLFVAFGTTLFLSHWVIRVTAVIPMRSNDLLLFFSENKNIRSLLHPKMRPRRKQNFPAYLPLLTTFLVSQHFCPIRFASVSFRTCLSPSLTLNFLNTYSAIRKIRIILPWPQHEA